MDRNIYVENDQGIHSLAFTDSKEVKDAKIERCKSRNFVKESLSMRGVESIKFPKFDRRIVGIVVAVVLLDIPLLNFDLGVSSIFTAPWAYADVTPTLTTDKPDYHPAEIVQISGSGFTPNTSYDIVVIRPDGSIVKSDRTPGFDTVVADTVGSFVYLYDLDGITGLYMVNVYDSSDPSHSTILASTTFTDTAAPSAKLSHFANIKFPNEYTSGNLNNNIASYPEGASIPYRYLAADAQEGAVIVLNVMYQFKANEGGSDVDNAFDFLTSDDESQSITDPIRFGIDAASKPSGFGLTSPCTNLVTISIPNDLADPPFDAATDPDNFRLCSNFPISGSATFVGISGNDKVIKLRLVMGSNGDLTLDEQNVDFALFFGAHLALDSDWPGANNGASDISGAPFHMRIEGFHDDNDNGVQNKPGEKSIGAEDRSVSSGVAKELGTITIIKDTVPDDAQDFSFTHNIVSSPVVASPFLLDDDASGPLSNMQIFAGVTVGSYTVTEAAVAGFATTTVCIDPDNGSSPSTSTATNVATIDVDAGETITCTYTNTKLGTINIIKDTVPDDAQDFSFTHNIVSSPVVASPFLLDDDADGTLSNTKTFTNVVLGSGYSVAETPNPDFDTTSDCDDDNLTPSTVNNINVSPGETVTCTFTNTKQANCILGAQPDDPISMNTVRNNNFAKTIHAEKQVFNCKLEQGDIPVIVDVTIIAEIYEDITTKSIIKKQALVATCTKDAATGTVIECKATSPSQDPVFVRNCSEVRIEHPQEMNTINKGSTVKTIESQKEVFLCSFGDASKKVDLVLFTEIWEDLRLLPDNPVVKLTFEAFRCVVNVGEATVESCVFSNVED